MLKKAAILLALGAALMIPTTAAAAAHHKHHPRPVICHKGFVRKAKIVKRHGRFHVVHYCKRRKIQATPVTAPVSASKSSGRLPHAHLDPTFEQDPLNPFQTNWYYSADATEEITDFRGFTESVPAPLPEGTLSFFVNGSLECAANVGPGQESDNCDVTLDALGPQRVTTTYSSGSLSSTVTEIDVVEPLVAEAAFAVEYEELEQSILTGGLDEYQVGWLNFHGSLGPSTAGSVQEQNTFSACTSVEQEAGCFAIHYSPQGIPQPLLGSDGNGKLKVFMRHPAEAPEVRVESAQTAPGMTTWLPVALVEDGSHFFQMVPHAAAGWITPTRHVAAAFHPEVR